MIMIIVLFVKGCILTKKDAIELNVSAKSSCTKIVTMIT